MNIKIILVTKEFEESAKLIILEGLAERFGYLDDSYNSDLNDIMGNYMDKGNSFMIGVIQGNVICTGALTNESKQIGRIERMSVKREFRGKGYAKLMLSTLEKEAKKRGYQKLIIETNRDWESAIELYKRNGFIISHFDSENAYFYKSC
jgi:GNAT superfamily N-acetyltransferase